MTKERLLRALTTPILLLPAALVLALMVVSPAQCSSGMVSRQMGTRRRFLAIATGA